MQRVGNAKKFRRRTRQEGGKVKTGKKERKKERKKKEMKSRKG